MMEGSGGGGGYRSGYRASGGGNHPGD